jgi:integrase
MVDIDIKIKEANGRLKETHAKISIERDGNMLRLRGTFPPRDGSSDERRQRIPLGLPATVEGVREAEIEALSIRKDLTLGIFSWDKYLKPLDKPLESKAKTIGDWLEEFELAYFEAREKNLKSLTTWKTDYLAVLKFLPKDETLEPEILKKHLLSTKADSKNRKRYALVLKKFGAFSGLDCDFNHLSGRYGLKELKPRDIPDDKKILQVYRKIENPYHKWIFGILATYGLRNHEVFRLDFKKLLSGNTVLSVLEGKSGPRRVWPIYPEWFSEFNLSAVKIPSIRLDRPNSALGNYVTHFFSRHIPFSAYTLRHAWAIRSLYFGLDISLASQQMGHSVEIHSKTYHHWISDKHHERAYDLLLQREEKPKPPTL